MSLELPYGLKRLNEGPDSFWYGPYASVAAANAAVPSAVRLKRTVLIGTAEYWWLNGIADIDLIVKGVDPGVVFPEVILKTITQTAHGFAVKDVVRLNSGGAYVKVSDPSTQFKVGLVTEVVNANTFKIAIHGYVTGLSGLTPGSVYYGQADGTISTTVSDMPVLHADTASSGYLINSGVGGGTTPPPGSILFGDTTTLWGNTTVTFND